MIGYLLVIAGAAVGAPARYLTDRIAQTRWDTVFPFGTVTVNIVGSLILGVIVAATLAGSPTHLNILIGTGFCGTLTTYSTFSTFSYETVRLLQERATRAAIANAVITVITGIAAATTGFALTTAIAG